MSDPKFSRAASDLSQAIDEFLHRYKDSPHLNPLTQMALEEASECVLDDARSAAPDPPDTHIRENSAPLGFDF